MEVLKKTKWHRFVGTWVDAESGGTFLKQTYSWKFKDQVIEINSSELGNKESVSIMGLNAKTNQVYLVTADNEGTSSLGVYDLKLAKATLGLKFTKADGSEGAVNIQHRLVDNDTMIITFQTDPPLPFRMKRKNN